MLNGLPTANAFSVAMLTECATPCAQASSVCARHRKRRSLGLPTLLSTPSAWINGRHRRPQQHLISALPATRCEEQRRRQIKQIGHRHCVRLLINHSRQRSHCLFIAQTTGDQLRHGLCSGGIGCVDGFSQLCVMQNRAAFPDRGEQRGADCACGNTHKIGKPHRRWHSFRRQARKNNRLQRDKEERHRGTLQNSRDQDGGEVGLRVEVRTHPQHDTEPDERHRGQLARVDVADIFCRPTAK